MHQEHLTNAIIRKKFKNNFDLCNLAISIGRSMILGGNPATLDEIIEAVDERIESTRRSEEK